MDMLAGLIGCDGRDVVDLMARDTILNVSAAYLRPGFAFGGSCLPKDLRAMEALAAENHQILPLLSSVLASNRRRIEQTLEALLGRPARRLGLIGLSFKKGSDDLRDSPYVELARHLLCNGFEITIYDSDVNPGRLVGANREYVMGRLPQLARLLVDSPEEACAQAEAVVVGKRLLKPEALRAMAPDGAVIYELDRTASFPAYNGSAKEETRPGHEKAGHG
jgi:GDP-mannose 6-dehydrogenase